jgi:HPt (histidine-containing phosphotransfer) domain-containing protein
MSVAHTTTQELLDIRSLREIAGEDVLFVLRVLDLFASTVPLQLVELRDSIQAGDLTTAQRIAHHIKGASQSIGAGQMAEWTQRLESNLTDSPTEVALSLLVKLETVWDQTLVAVRGEA